MLNYYGKGSRCEKCFKRNCYEEIIDFYFLGYYRYSHYDTCNYQLVDSYTNSVSLNYWNRTCAVGYDMCANERDLRNSVEYDNRYFCAETFRDRYYNF